MNVVLTVVLYLLLKNNLTLKQGLKLIENCSQTTELATGETYQPFSKSASSGNFCRNVIYVVLLTRLQQMS